MENIENLDGKAKIIEETRQKISELVEVEKKRKERSPTDFNPNLTLITPELLRDIDIENFRKFLDQTLTKEDFEKYKKENVVISSPKDEVERSRSALAGHLNNQLMSPKNQKWYDPENYKQMVELGLLDETDEK